MGLRLFQSQYWFSHLEIKAFGFYKCIIFFHHVAGVMKTLGSSCIVECCREVSGVQWCKMHMCMFDADPHECSDIYSQGRLNLVPVLPPASLFIFPPLPGWRRVCVSIDLLPACWEDTKAAPGEIRFQLGLPLKRTHAHSRPLKGFSFSAS